MLNNIYLLNICSGILSGLIASLIYGFLINYIKRPSIRVSKDIGVEVLQDGQHIYRIRISNESKRDAYEVRIFFRLRYRNKYMTIEQPFVPVLCAKKGENDNPNKFQRELPFKLTNIRKSKIEGFGCDELVKKYDNGTLCFDDFKDEETQLEIILFAVDGKSGLGFKSIVRTYDYKELSEHKKEGKYDVKTLKIKKKNTEDPIE